MHSPKLKPPPPWLRHCAVKCGVGGLKRVLCAFTLVFFYHRVGSYFIFNSQYYRTHGNYISTVVFIYFSVCSADISEDSGILAVGYGNSAVQVFSLAPDKKLKPLKPASDLERLDKDAGWIKIPAIFVYVLGSFHNEINELCR